jgi:RimJ/RimL family protein N-acetyltransferase
LGDLWTAPAHRGKGLATAAISEAIRARAAPGRRFFYIVHDHNIASIKAAERAGLHLAGRADRTARLGVRALGAYVLRAESPG